MDEILRPPRPEAGVKPAESILVRQPAQGLPGRLRRLWAAVRSGARTAGRMASAGYYRADGALAGRKLLSPVPFLAAAGAAAAALVVSTVYTPSYVVAVDGLELGTVTDPAVFERVVERVEDRASAILGYEYTMDRQVEYAFALTQRDEISPVNVFETYMFNQVDEVMKTYVLTVDGSLIGAAADKADLDGLLKELAAPYVTENTTKVEYVEDVQIAYQYAPSGIQQDLDAMREVLTANTSGRTTYEVAAGDTYSEIAYANGMSLDELMALNPQASLDSLLVGDVLTVKKTVPYLSVRTVDAVVYNETVPYPVEQVEDSAMYQGDTKVLTAGVPGEALVSANVTYVDGYEEGREVTDTVILSEPVTEVVAVGVKERPRTMPTGSFQWPLSGQLTSYFGYRSIFGSTSYHGGIDIAAAQGTAIAAADGGTVIWSGSKGTYGNLVIVSHGNGLQTYYGHCSSLLVCAGDQVYKGQTIALVGSTGRSTGPHCHFEVKLNGTSVNPLSYLP